MTSAPLCTTVLVLRSVPPVLLPSTQNKELSDCWKQGPSDTRSGALHTHRGLLCNRGQPRPQLPATVTSVKPLTLFPATLCLHVLAWFPVDGSAGLATWMGLAGQQVFSSDPKPPSLPLSFCDPKAWTSPLCLFPKLSFQTLDLQGCSLDLH